MLGLAGLAFAACSNDDEVSNFDNGEKQSVVIKIDTANGELTRALGPSVDDQNGQKIQLNDVTIFFATEGGNVVKTTSIDGKQTENWSKLTGTGYIEHNVPTSVKKVFVVGNKEAFLNVNMAQIATQEELKTKAIAAATQTDITKLALYGEGSTLEEVQPQVDHGHKTTTFTTTATLAPLMSRIEISGIQCKDLGNQYTSIDLKAIGLMNVAQKSNLKKDHLENLTLANVVEPGQSGDFVFGSTDFWAWDEITGVSFKNSNDIHPTIALPNAKQDVYGYNFFATNENDLQVKLYVAAKQGEITNPVNNTVTASFSKTTFEPGKIYKVTLAFNEKNIGPWNPDLVQCIEVKVEVAEWKIETLTPEYQ